MNEAFSYSTGPEAEQEEQRWNEEKSARIATMELNEKAEILKKFNEIKIGDRIAYKNKTGKLIQGYVVREKVDTDLNIITGPETQNSPFDHTTTISVEEIIDFYTPKE